jgi:hypothetical protein
MTESITLRQPLSLTLPVRFHRGKLWKARYPTLIDDDLAPRGFQFEPAFQVRSADPDQEVEVFFVIPDEENAVFDAAPDGSVRHQILVPPDPAKPTPDVTVTLSDTAGRRCRVRWKRSGAPLTALRILCRHLEPGPKEDHDLSVTEGGAYLVIIDRGDLPVEPHEAACSPAGEAVAGTVRILGIDENSRPVYDLFRQDFSTPAGLALEPAFRAAHGQQCYLGLALDLPAVYAGVQFKVDPGTGQVERDFVTPGQKPESLIGIPAPKDDWRTCTVKWSRGPLSVCVAGSAEAGSPTCLQGRTANFSVRLDLPADLANALGPVGVDPTVIEPPACDASGVCSPPHEKRGDGDED